MGDMKLQSELRIQINSQEFIWGDINSLVCKKEKAMKLLLVITGDDGSFRLFENTQKKDLLKASETHLSTIFHSWISVFYGQKTLWKYCRQSTSAHRLKTSKMYITNRNGLRTKPCRTPSDVKCKEVWIGLYFMRREHLKYNWGDE